METPTAYARHLCSYISSPTKVLSYTEVAFGKGNAPRLSEIKAMRAKVEHHKSRRRVDLRLSEPARIKPKLVEPLPVVKAEPRRYNKCGKPYYPTTVEICPDYQPPEKVFGHTDLVTAVANMFMITVDEVKGKSRKPQIVVARMVAIRLMAERGNSIAKAALVIKRDRSTATQNDQNWDANLRKWPAMAEAYERLKHLGKKA